MARQVMSVMRNKGFTLIEISIVLVIIGLLMAGVIKGMSFVQSAKITNAITLTQDLSAAINIFKQQYHMLPGDMSINSANPEIPNIQNPVCKNGGDSNGLIGDKNGNFDPNESLCVAEILFRAGLAKVDQDNGVAVFKTYYGNANVIATKYSAVGSALFFPSIIHVVELQNIPCDVANAIDSKIDDGDTASGKVMSNPPCTSGASDVPATTTLDIAL